MSSNSYSLLCVILNEPPKLPSVFRVTVLAENDVIQLQKAIKKEKEYDLEPCDPDSLVLWKLNVDLAVGSVKDLAERIKALGELSQFATELDEPTKQMSLCFDHQPSHVNVHIIVKKPVIAPTVLGRKRPFDEVDPSDDIGAALIRPFDDIPNCAKDILLLIQAPLLHKLPVSGELFHMIETKHPSDLELFQPATGSMAEAFTMALTDLPARFAEDSGSEDMLHLSVDLMIRLPLRTLSLCVKGQLSLPIQMDRNRTDEETSTKLSCRPDFLLWLQDILLFWGEEKAKSGAKADLLKKFETIDPVIFGEIQFMLCYTADGTRICFYAVDNSKEFDPFVPLTDSLDMHSFLHRFQILHTVINIARILVTIKNHLPTNYYPLGKKEKIGDSEIAFFFDCVEKKVLVSDLPYCKQDLKLRLGFLQKMYKHAIGHRGLVQVKDGPELNSSNTYYKVTLKTRGIRPSLRNEDALRGMTKDLISGLSWLHSRGYLHRDVRFPNVIYDPSTKQYVLIDFEHGGSEPPQPNVNSSSRTRSSNTRQPPKPRRKRGSTTDETIRLRGWDDATLNDGKYTKSSEMYQLGKMLSGDFSSLVSSQSGKDFIARLMRKEMTAEESLAHEWIHALP